MRDYEDAHYDCKMESNSQNACIKREKLFNELIKKGYCFDRGEQEWNKCDLSNNVASSNSNNNQISAQLKEEIGITMAECSGWYISAFIILSKIPDGMDSATRNNELGLMTMDFAKKMIGGARADQISSSPMRQTNQAMKQGTIDQWIQTVGQKTDNCQAYLQNNQPQIKLALDN
jgi:hypothetical protein